MENLGCPLCDSELVILDAKDPEYHRSLMIKDGILKWFKCSGCQCKFIKDKQAGTWSYSPDTYTRLLKEEIIEDKLA